MDTLRIVKTRLSSLTESFPSPLQTETQDQSLTFRTQTQDWSENGLFGASENVAEYFPSLSSPWTAPVACETESERR